jgi:hypothetical protein
MQIISSVDMHQCGIFGHSTYFVKCDLFVSVQKKQPPDLGADVDPSQAREGSLS